MPPFNTAAIQKAAREEEYKASTSSSGEANPLQPVAPKAMQLLQLQREPPWATYGPGAAPGAARERSQASGFL